MTIEEIQDAIQQWKDEDKERRCFILLADSDVTQSNVEMQFSGKGIYLLTMLLTSICEDVDFRRLVTDAVNVFERRRKLPKPEVKKQNADKPA